MTLPGGPVQMAPDTITSYIRQMQAQVDEATRQTLYSAVVSSGGLTIRQGGAFVITNSSGTYNVLETRTRTWPDGTSYQPVVINRPPTGEPAFSIYPAGGSGAPFYWVLYDRGGRLAITDDAISGVGLAKPYLSVAMSPRYPMPVNPGGPTDMQVPNTASQGSGQPYWWGKIPYVSHPYLSLTGVWGWASGGTGTITYTLTAGSASVSWTATGAVILDTPLLDLRSQNGVSNLDIKLTMSFANSPAGNVYCQVYGAFLRGT